MKIQAVRGMQDLLPRQKEIFRFVEDKVRDVLRSYGYQELGFPVIESTDLFSRLVGEATDVVEKEMYTFPDRNGDSLTLRPEGTAGIVRLAQENGKGVRGRHRLGRTTLAGDDLDQRHPIDRIEEVQSHDAFRTKRSGSDIGDRQ